MAQTLTPVASSSIQYDISPVVEPPTTDFPYPESKRTSRTPSQDRAASDDSDITLANSIRSAADSHITASATRRTSAPAVERPVLADKRFETEVPQRVASRPVLDQGLRHSTGARPKNEDALQRRVSSSSDSSSGSESSAEENDKLHADLDRQRSNPARRDLAPRELNRTRLRPWHEQKRQRIDVGNEHFRTQGKIARDGRLNVKVSETANTGYLAKALGSTLKGHLHPHAKQAREDAEELKKQFDETKATTKIPRMNIVIMVIGSRGDVQPFLKIGRILQDKYGHRVRIATHPAFRKFVQDEIGLEFFSIGGDPSELMSFMVRNPGLIPSFETLTSARRLACAASSPGSSS